MHNSDGNIRRHLTVQTHSQADIVSQMTPVLRSAQMKVVQQNPFVQCAREPISLAAFELEPSTSYRQHESVYNGSRCYVSMQNPKKQRHRRRTLQLSSATAALHQNSLQNDCFAALGAQIRRSARHHMMGWPADVRRFLAGAFAGAISKTATAPIESVRMQIMTGTKGSVLEIVRRTYEQGGLLAFFSGNEADVLRTMPSKAIELASFDLYKKAFGSLRPKGADGKRHPSGLGVTVAGALAGVTSTLAMFPLETVRTRLAVDHKTYRNVSTAFRLILGQEGIPAFYRGLGASVLGAIPYSAIRLGSYDGLKWAYKKSTGQENVPPHLTMVFGAVAAIASSSASFPLEIVRRRAMMGTLPTKGTLAALMAIARTEGVGALYAGVWLTWVKQAPQYAVTFLCYDLAKAWLAAENGHAERERRAFEEAQIRDCSNYSSTGRMGLPAPFSKPSPAPHG